ncbi:MAG: zinc-dependent alcohol dehydrogenase family protein [Syntrophobacteraceae bacterium]|nr:zinc-dependent alcohol dehydrogenase family protein [Syntrophobacteraceae bacterium]
MGNTITFTHERNVMKAMVLEGCASVESAPLKWMDLPDPIPGPGEVRVRVRTCGVCRTDLHVIECELPFQGHSIIPGHQVVGVIDRLGPGAKRFKTGQRIGIAWLRKTCGVCDFCRAGKENLCESSRFTGYHEHGGYAELAVVNEEFAYAIPEVFSDEQASPLLCAGIIGYRSLKRSGLSPRQRLALYGFGSSAHIVIQIALSMGCEVYVCTRGAKHRELAKSLGANWVGEDPGDMPAPADSAIIFAPAGGLVPLALEHLKKGGTLALAGIYMSPTPELDYESHLFYEKNIHSVTANTRRDGEELLRIAAEIPVKPQVQLFPLREANRALLWLKEDRLEGSGVLVVDSGGTK